MPLTQTRTTILLLLIFNTQDMERFSMMFKTVIININLFLEFHIFLKIKY